MNEMLCRVGPGTPGGEYMRRYWQPVGLSADVTPGGKPKQIRIMGEDLVLFRDEDGRPGLVGLHCSHRLVSLAYGRVEDGGIRCPMHGWVYDVNGRCLEQPAEPDETFKDRIQHPAYPCRDLGGLIFTYMGPPDKMPLLPNYESLARADGTRWVSYYPIVGNYVQHLEGAWDTVHGAYLHMDSWSTMKHELAAIPKPIITCLETDYGLWERADKAHPGGTVGPIFGYFFMPAGWLRLHGTYGGDYQKYQSWYVPVDDGHTIRFQVAFAPLNPDGTPYQWRPADGLMAQPGPDEDYGRDYDHIDSISGISPATPATFRAQDTMANETQGYPWADRSQERLGAHDGVVMSMRLMMLKAIADVQKGLEPKHIIHDPAQNELYIIRGDDADELMPGERAEMATSG
jgi:nitrite reductase/ring-hydroxylating ferredoxin subunit